MQYIHWFSFIYRERWRLEVISRAFLPSVPLVHIQTAPTISVVVVVEELAADVVVVVA